MLGCLSAPAVAGVRTPQLLTPPLRGLPRRWTSWGRPAIGGFTTALKQFLRPAGFQDFPMPWPFPWLR